MSGLRRQSGFSLIAAIFLLVVVAVLVAYIANIRVAQQTTLVYGVRGAQALAAARSGIEWGVYQAIVAGSCAPVSTFVVPQPALSDYTIQVGCTSSGHVEGATLVTTYRLTSSASAGTFGSLDFVQRGLQATVSIDPP